MEITKTLRQLEEKLQTHSVRTNSAAVSSMLTEDFKEFGSSGRIFSKAEILRELQADFPAHIAMHDFHASLLTEQVAWVTYRSIRQQPGSPPAESLRSSLWIFHEGRWQMRFHQGTKVLQNSPTIPAPSPTHHRRVPHSNFALVAKLEWGF
jgi:hypothetical protein